MVEYKLKSPIVLGEDTVEVLKLEEPNGKKLDMYDVSFDEASLYSVGGLMKIINACSTNTTEAHVGEMKGRDIREAGEVCLTNFFL